MRKRIMQSILATVLVTGASRAGTIYTSTDAQAVSDTLPAAMSHLVVPTAITITDVNVIINQLTHTAVGDLQIFIISPMGTQVQLFDRRGGGGDDLTNTVFDDSATQTLGDGTAPYTGTFQAEQLLSLLNGENGAGEWTLKVSDVAVGDNGTIDSWSLDLSGDPAGIPEPSTVGMMLAGGAVLLTRKLKK